MEEYANKKLKDENPQGLSKEAAEHEKRRKNNEISESYDSEKNSDSRKKGSHVILGPDKNADKDS